MGEFILTKKVDQSLLKAGLTIPNKAVSKLLSSLGCSLVRGQKETIEIILDGVSYQANITYVNLQESNRDVYQIRYGENSVLAVYLRDVFKKSIGAYAETKEYLEIHSYAPQKLEFKCFSDSAKSAFFKSLGNENDLAGFQRSYKLIFLKYLFENDSWKNGIECNKLAKEFRGFYVKRKESGKLPDINVDKVIGYPESSTIDQVLGLIKRNPYNVINNKGFVQIENKSGVDYFVLSDQLKSELVEKDIDTIRQLVNKKIDLYFSKIDNEMGTSSMREAIDKFINEYVLVKKQVFSGNPFGTFVRNDIPNTIYETGIVDRNTHLITGSVGQGNWAMVPWICIFDRKITTTAQKGVYIVYLLSKDGKSLYLTFNQGCTDLRNNNSKKDTIKIMRERARKIVDVIDSRGFKTDENINLGEGLTELGELYQKGTIFYKEYRKSIVPSENELREDLQKMMDIYEDYVASMTEGIWWPSLTEYNPGISKEQWITLLQDPEIIGPVWGEVLAMFYTEKSGATCKIIEQKFGKSAASVNSTCRHLAQHIYNITKCPLANSEDEPGRNRYWPILFQGRDAKKDEPGNWVWRLREELYDALTEVNILRFLEKGGKEEMTTKDVLENIKKYIAAKGFTYKDSLIENFYLSLKSKPFVILAGTSGTGKTKLVKLFAEAIDANYKLVSVRPDWSDSSDLFGHVNLKNEFVPGVIIDYVKRAELDPNKPYFLCLDEMNLARVEYYLSDFLSIIETRHRDNNSIVTDEIILDKSAEKKYGKVILPDNLYVIGTVNMDETTFPFSKKVLDRANTIEFSYVDLIPTFEDYLSILYPIPQRNEFLVTKYITLKADTTMEDRDFIVKVCEELQDINIILQKANAHVGYRVRDEIVFYMLNNRNADLLNDEEAFDFEIMQKILPRLQGSSGSVKEMLCELFKKFAGDYTGLSQASISEQMQEYLNSKTCKYRRSAEKICYMMRRFEEDGFTSYWL